MAYKNNLTGNRYGRLIVLKENGKTNHGDLRWLCKCDCGNIKTITGTKLKSGWTKSCGCLQKEIARKHMLKHGLSDSRLYSIWENMKERCYRPSNNRYYRYGARGIKVCKEWLDFEKFAEWANKNGYKDGLSIERVDIDGNYEPNNCCWIPLKEQTQNRENTVWIYYQGKRFCMSQFAKDMGVSINVIRNRIKHGLSGDEMAKEFLNADSRG